MSPKLPCARTVHRLRRAPRRIETLVLICAILPAAMLMAAETDIAAQATNQMGLELLRVEMPGGSQPNRLLSPYSIELALAMAFAGADGETHREMARVLHFPEGESSLQASFAALRVSLEQAVVRSEAIAKFASESARGGLFRRNSSADDAKEKPRVDTVQLSVANRLFGQSGFRYDEAFLRATKDGYGAPLEFLDFRRDPDASRLTINGWVEEQTRKKISNLIPPNGVGAGTRLVLVNAIYFKAPWADRFQPSFTKKMPFYPTAAEATEVPTMGTTGWFGYAQNDTFTAVTLPYHGGALQFLIILPQSRDGLKATVEKMTAAELSGFARLPSRTIHLFLPKFRMEPPTLALSGSLKKLGLRTVFDEPKGSANFARMAARQPNEYLAVAEVFHKTFIAVDEQGTEAAAATAVAMLAMAGPPGKTEPPPEVHVDHPFLFAIQDQTSGACLFLGVVGYPQ